mmetsp:Transcript_16608/g.47285  ORF Transcript_16608/g.47285 Transcript_16608/m.47285 type:complete len:111 (-) Transcript_16608:131-463(-)
MTYVSIQLGEILTLMTYRTDCPFWQARFSRVYTSMLVFNVLSLALVLYVPPVTELLKLAPLTPGRFVIACIAPVLLVSASEVIKIGYRQQLRTELAMVGAWTPPHKELDP